MSLFALAATATAESTDVEHTLPMPPWAFGVLALVAFAVLLGVTYSFKSVGVHHGEKH